MSFFLLLLPVERSNLDSFPFSSLSSRLPAFCSVCLEGLWKNQLRRISLIDTFVSTVSCIGSSASLPSLFARPHVERSPREDCADISLFCYPHPPLDRSRKRPDSPVPSRAYSSRTPSLCLSIGRTILHQLVPPRRSSPRTRRFGLGRRDRAGSCSWKVEGRG